jgi:methylphosphotriester-DNA--protein-cysteine methyltransferase
VTARRPERSAATQGAPVRRLDCKVARRALQEGGPYAQQRVFFADEATAIAAGYRPCAKCMPDEYRAWKQKSR